MTQGSDYGLIQDVLMAIALFGGVVLYRKDNLPQENIKNLTALNDTYEKRIASMEEELRTQRKLQINTTAALAELQGQVKVYKELPLQELADGLHETVKVNKENADVNRENNAISRKILEQLQQTAQIAAEDRDVLTNQNKHIASEVRKEMAK